MSEFKDFDAAWAAQERKPLKAKVLGKVYTFPARMPAKVILRIARIQKKAESSEEQVEIDEMFNLLRPMVGAATVEEWVEKDIDMGQIEDVIDWIMANYGQRRKATEANGANGSEAAEGDVDPPRALEATSLTPSSHVGA